jgi:hypothetical protein
MIILSSESFITDNISVVWDRIVIAVKEELTGEYKQLQEIHNVYSSTDLQIVANVYLVPL